MPFRVMSLEAPICGYHRNWVRASYLPPYHLASAFPIFAPLEPSIPSNKFLQDRMQLIFCPHSQLESIHKGDKTLEVVSGDN